MKEDNNIWQELEKSYLEYKELKIEDSVDFLKFQLYTNVYNSTAIEGATLTEFQTTNLLEKGLTPQGKPIEHSLMVTDCYKALKFVIEKASAKTEITPEFLIELNSIVMHSTGGIHNNILGTIDSSKGEFRNCAVFAEGGGYYLAHDKVKGAIQKLCEGLNKQLSKENSLIRKFRLSFDAHYYLVGIHPWLDGNGRTSRLLMNYIQKYYSLPLTTVNMTNREFYIESLVDSRKKEDINIFRSFMAGETARFFNEKIDEYKKSLRQSRSKGMRFIF